MGIFFKSASSSSDEVEAIPALRWAVAMTPPTATTDATRLINAKIAEAWPGLTVDKPLQIALEKAAMTSPPQSTDVGQAAASLYTSVKKQRKKSGADGGPNWKVFIAAALLLVVLLIFTTWVAWAADGQPKDVTSSQLKTLSTTLTTAFTTLLGAIVGIITGEAVTKKGGMSGQ